jgi:hypothetical protein
MKTHNASIYHCLRCGRVEHLESDAKAPECCGSEMTEASTETISGEEPGKSTPQSQASGHPVGKGERRDAD